MRARREFRGDARADLLWSVTPRTRMHDTDGFTSGWNGRESFFVESRSSMARQWARSWTREAELSPAESWRDYGFVLLIFLIILRRGLKNLVKRLWGLRNLPIGETGRMFI